MRTYYALHSRLVGCSNSKRSIPIKFGIRNGEILRPRYVERHMRYQMKALGPRIKACYAEVPKSGPDQRGRRRQVPGGPEPGHPQGMVF